MPRTPLDTKKRDLVKDLVDRAGYSYKQVADELGISRQRVHQLYANYQSYASKLGQKSFAKYSHYATAPRYDFCRMCGNKERLHVHHKDRNSSNNNPRNLIVLCSSCHGQVHQGNPHRARKTQNT